MRQVLAVGRRSMDIVQIKAERHGIVNRPPEHDRNLLSIVDYIVGTKYIIGSLRTQETVDQIRDIIGPKTWYEYGAKINTGD